MKASNPEPLDNARCCPLARLFLHQVAQHPHRTALKTDEEAINFQDLLGRARSVQQALRVTAPPRPLVALLTPHGGVAELSSLLAVLLENGSFVPVDLSLPTPRRAEILRDANPDVAIVSVGTLADFDIDRDRGEGRAADSRSQCSAKGWEMWLDSLASLPPAVPVVQIGPGGHPTEPGDMHRGPSATSLQLTWRREPDRVPDMSDVTAELTDVDTQDEKMLQGREGAGDNDLLYIMYTSGTTGRSKGVRGTRTGALNRLRFAWETFPFKDNHPDQDMVARRTPLTFVDSIAEVLTPLLAGVPLYLPPRGAFADPGALLPALERSGATRLSLTPSLLASTLRIACGRAGGLPAKLRMWLVSGEALHVQLVKDFARLARPGSQLVNLYGSTEVAGDATYCTLNDILEENGLCGIEGDFTGPSFSNEAAHPFLPPEEIPPAMSGTGLRGQGGRWGSLIGRAIPGAFVSVVSVTGDSRKGLGTPRLPLSPLPDGQAGELVVAGAGVALGYHRRPQENSDKFLSGDRSGLGVSAGQRLFRTGDLVVRRPGGPLFWLGRLDDEVKVRGVRVCQEAASALACKAAGMPLGSLVLAWDPGKKREGEDGHTRKGEEDYAQDSSRVHAYGSTDDVLATTAAIAPDRGRILGFYEAGVKMELGEVENDGCKGKGRGRDGDGNGEEKGAEHLRQVLATKLTPLEMPAELVSFPGRLPLTSSGKVDRHSLLRFYHSQRKSSSRHHRAEMNADMGPETARFTLTGPGGHPETPGDIMVAARSAIANAVCQTLPWSEGKVMEWLAVPPPVQVQCMGDFQKGVPSDCSVIEQEGYRPLLSFAELGGTSMLAVEAAWIASRGGGAGVATTVSLPLQPGLATSPSEHTEVLEASDLLRGSLSDAASHLADKWARARNQSPTIPKETTGADTEVRGVILGARQSEGLTLHSQENYQRKYGPFWGVLPARAEGGSLDERVVRDPSASSKGSVGGRTIPPELDKGMGGSPSSVLRGEKPQAHRPSKRLRSWATKERAQQVAAGARATAKDMPRRFLAVGRSGIWLGLHPPSCLERIVEEVVPVRVEMQVCWSSCLGKCIDASPLLVVPVHGAGGDHTPSDRVPFGSSASDPLPSFSSPLASVEPRVTVGWGKEGLSCRYCRVLRSGESDTSSGPSVDIDRSPAVHHSEEVWPPQPEGESGEGEPSGGQGGDKGIVPTVCSSRMSGRDNTSAVRAHEACTMTCSGATVYIGSHSGVFQSLSLISGKVRWSVTLGDRVESGAAASTGVEGRDAGCGARVFVGCHNGLIYALHSRSGETLWTFRTGDVVKCTPVALPVDPIDEAARFLSLKPASGGAGDPRRAKRTPGDGGAAGSARDPVSGAGAHGGTGVRNNHLESGVVLAGSHDGWLYCVSQGGGDLRWRVCCGGAIFASPIWNSHAGSVYVCTTKGHLLSVIPLPLTPRPVTGGPNRQRDDDAWGSYASPPPKLHHHADCDARKSGGARVQPMVAWDRRLPAPCFSTPALCTSTGVLVLGCVDGGLYGYSSGGDRVWSCLRGGKPVFSSPCVVPIVTARRESSGGIVSGPPSTGESVFKSVAITGCHDGTLRSISVKDGRVLWEAPLGWKGNGIPRLNAKKKTTVGMGVSIADGGPRTEAESGEREGPDQVSGPGVRAGSITGSGKGTSQGSDSRNNPDPIFSSPFASLIPCSCCSSPCPLVFTCAASSGNLVALRLSDGVAMGWLRLPGELFSSPVVVGYWLVVGCRDNYVYGVRVRVWCCECQDATKYVKDAE